MIKRVFGTVACGVWAAVAAISPSEVVSLPGDAAYGGGDKVGSQLVAATYNGARVRESGLWPMAATGSTITGPCLPKTTRRVACVLCR